MNNLNRKSIMKKLLLPIISILVLFCFSNQARAQKVFVTNSEIQANVKVYVVNYESQADLVVYKTQNEIDARGKNNGVWYFTKNAVNADKKIYFVKNEIQSQLKIYYTKNKIQAGWKNSSKKHLMQK